MGANTSAIVIANGYHIEIEAKVIATKKLVIEGGSESNKGIRAGFGKHMIGRNEISFNFIDIK